MYAGKRGKGIFGRGIKPKVMAFILLPIIPLPMALLDGPYANAGRLE